MPSFCNPDKITVPPNRFRSAEPTEVEEMAKSMKEVGQLQPILVDKDMNLTAGLHRLMACKKLGRDVWFATEEEGQLILDNPMLRRMAEYQENFRRKEFTPAEKNFAIAEIDRLMREIYGSKKSGVGTSASEGEWTQADTAKKLGLKSHRPVSEAIAITKAIEKGVPGVADAKTTQEAIGIVKNVCRIEAAAELAKRRAVTDPDAEIQNPMEYFSNKIILGNCLEGMRQLASGICNLFITDPPWRIEADKSVDSHGSAMQKAASGYDDSSEEIIPLIKNVVSEMYRVAKTDCYVVMFCGAKYWLEFAEYYRSKGFQVYDKPLVWVKAEGDKACSSKSPAPSIWPASITDFMLLARKGNPVLSQLHKGDAFISPPINRNDRCHQAQKPIRLMEEIISRFYHPGTNPLLIDPFCGSGSTLIAARRVGIRQYFGYELSKDNRERALAYMVNTYMKELEGKEPSTTIDLDEYE